MQRIKKIWPQKGLVEIQWGKNLDDTEISG